MNKVILIGNLVREVEIRTVSVNGNNYQIFKNAIAVKRPFKNRNGEYDVDYIDIELWGKQCDYVKSYASKGSKVAISGKLQMRDYEDKEGKQCKAVVIVIDEIELITYKQSSKDLTPNDFDIPNNERPKANVESNESTIDPFEKEFEEIKKKQLQGKQPSMDDLPF